MLFGAADFSKNRMSVFEEADVVLIPVANWRKKHSSHKSAL
jgi:hypothetical protein